ncbi:hypothetical protein CR513_29981, partial [Mucuna pruriens]
MVITIEVANFVVKKIPKFEIRPYHEQLVGFSGERVDTHECIDLLTTFGDLGETSYNILIDRSTLNTLGATIFTLHLVMTFPSSDGQVMTVKVDQKMARQCYVNSLKVVIKPPKEDNVSAHVKISTNVELDPRPSIDQGVEPIGKLEKVPLTNDEHYTQVHDLIDHSPIKELQHVALPWPLSTWGMDILGPFPKAKGQVKFLLVSVDYFTKWIKAEPLA